MLSEPLIKAILLNMLCIALGFWMYHQFMSGLKNYEIYEADEGSFVIAENPEGFKSKDKILIRKQ